ncbi:MAG: response regulator transcription factor [Gemmatimonadaceae bacterium]
MKKHVLLYGLVGGLVILLLRAVEYRYLVVEHSVEIYGALVAAVFAAIGIWLGQTLTRNRTRVVVKEVHVEVPLETTVEVSVAAGPFERNAERLDATGITPRELQILELIAEGLSTREIAERIFVSENTVKTHSSRLFDKLNVRRRTQAVQVGKQLGILP